MKIGLMRFQLYIPYSHSLKNKRQIVNRLKDKIRNKFNVSVCEKPSNNSKFSEINIVCINYSTEVIENTFNCIKKFVFQNREYEVLDFCKEFL